MSSYGFNDWAQDRRIRQAEESLARERRARNHLAAQMQAQQGNLKGQIDRLTQALVGLIEHEDIRGELAQFADAAAVRRYAHEVVATVVVTGTAAARGVAEPVDVPDYWLAAAIRGVAHGSAGETDGEALLDAAARRDPRQTAALLTLLDCQARSVRWSTGRLDPILPSNGPVTRVERQIWLAIAEGRLDAAAERALQSRLADQLPAEFDVSAGIAAILPKAQQGRPDSTPVAVTAAAALKRIKDWIDGTPDGFTEPDVDSAEDPLADCLRALIDEGSPGEADILHRMREARKAMGFEATGPAPIDPEEPVGELLGLLVDDLSGKSGDGAQRIAVAVLAPHLRNLTDRLEQDATTPSPDQYAVNVGREVIRVEATGPQGDWKAAVVKHVAASSPSGRGRRYGAIGGGVLALLSLALIPVSAAFLLFAIAGAILGGVMGFGILRGRKEEEARLDAAVRRTGREIQAASTRITNDREQRDAALARAHQDAAAIRSAL